MDLKEEQILGSSVTTHWYYVSKNKAIRMLLKPFSVGSVLDVGAGSGIFSKFLLDTGVARSARCVDTAYPFDRKSEIYNGKNISFVKSVENIDETLILKWVNMADLYRVKGIGSEYSELLEKAGVDTVKELRNRVPDNLYNKMVEINNSKKLVRQLPGLKRVKSWVDSAKKLPPMVTY